jgi:hypothetical protein
MTAASPTSLYFWVEYADGSLDYVFANGFIQGSFSPSYTTPADKIAVALYFCLLAPLR